MQHTFAKRVQGYKKVKNLIRFIDVRPANTRLKLDVCSIRAVTTVKTTLLLFHTLDSFHLPVQIRRIHEMPSSESVILVYPRYTRRFKRSLFFFLLLLQESKLTSIDWLTSVFNYSPFYSFTLFPVANTFKISIFKRLNMQKRLLTAQVYSYNDFCRTNFRTKPLPLLLFPAKSFPSGSSDLTTANFSLTQF